MQFIDSWLCSMRHLYPVCVHLLNIFAYTIGKVLFECFCLFLIVPLEIIQCSIPQSKHFTYFSLKVIVIFFFLLFFLSTANIIKILRRAQGYFRFFNCWKSRGFFRGFNICCRTYSINTFQRILTKFYIYTRTIFSTIK